jgi:hypothetical protein
VSILDGIEERRRLLRKRGFPLAAECMPPTGQAGLWHADVVLCVPRSGRDVAKQLARLCGDDSRVTVPWRSLADAVGVRDRGGRLRAYTERGVQVLVEAGWLAVEVAGRGRASRTTFQLLPGERTADWWVWDDEGDWLDETA